ncbi:MAG: 50S ribosomal protein L3 [Candidatus Omnitrophica bacterium]|nr:50S ribosomal protein L3 [Candidatus Omnitrophota bacterium]
MINGILGKKLGMTQIYGKGGEFLPVTVVQAGPCVVLQVKSYEKDGYKAVQLGFDEKKQSRTNKPLMGRFKKANVPAMSFIKEVTADTVEGIKPADKFTVDIFTPGEYVDVIGTSIGKGFQGGIKRWNQSRGPMSHGSMSHRAPGSVGPTEPPRTIKGLRMPSHMGNKRCTVQGLEVIELDKENNLLLLKGAVPGPANNYLIINKSTRKKKKVKPAAAPAAKKINPLKQSKKMMKK